MVSEPSADQTPNRNQRGVNDQDEPQVRPTDDEKRHIYADVVRPVRDGQQSDGCDTLRAGVTLLRIESPRLHQSLDSDRERQHPEKMNPPIRHGESAPDAQQGEAKDRRKTNVLPGHDTSRRNFPGKEQRQEKGVVNIRSSEGCYARAQHCQISIHNGY